MVRVPVKAGGLLVVIDGGFCQAYHKTTGIAGYTLISDPRGMRIKAHRPFGTIADVLDLNADIVSDDDRFEIYPSPKTIGDTDTGTQIRGQVADLRALLEAYRTGLLPERG
jgi:fructose-1,6-bisphosphatase-3